jgi:hypothetical protein
MAGQFSLSRRVRKHRVQRATHFRPVGDAGIHGDVRSPTIHGLLADEQPTGAAALATLRTTPVSQSLTTWTSVRLRRLVGDPVIGT